MDWERLSSELLRALRARRSQPAFARRLKYKSNVIYLWESGRAFPRFERTLAVAAAAGVDPIAALRRFYGPAHQPDWLRDLATGPPRFGELSVALLADLRGNTPVATLARRAGFSRFSVSRWLDGRTQPRLPQALALIEASSLRALDFVAALVDPAALPSFAQAHADLVAARRAAYELPFSQVVLHALELDAYRALPAHRPGFLAALLDMTLSDEEACLAALCAAGQARLNGARYEPTRIQTVDTRGHDARAQELRRYYAQLAVDRLGTAPAPASGYNVFAVSRADYARILELQRSYFAELRAIVATSEPAQVVGLASTQLLPLSQG